MTIRGYLNSILDNKQFANEFGRLLKLSSIIPIEDSLEKEMNRDIVESALAGIGKKGALRTKTGLGNDDTHMEECIYIEDTIMFGQPYALVYKDKDLQKVPKEQVIIG